LGIVERAERWYGKKQEAFGEGARKRVDGEIEKGGTDHTQTT